VLRLGQRLAVPRGDNHVVQRGETLFEISRRYGVDSYALAQANGIAPPYSVAPGQELRVPTAPSAAVAVATIPPPATPSPEVFETPAPQPAPPAPLPPRAIQIVPPPSVISTPPPRAERFAWPLQGQLLSSFGPKPGGLHNDGINIAARKGEPVRAAENGIVAYAGNELKGFGNLVLLRHADGWVTAYAHNDRIGVTRGVTVRRGQIIAHAGQSGSVTSPQLHFEIRQSNHPVDPVRYLAGGP